jgi:hypothetical protein
MIIKTGTYRNCDLLDGDKLELDQQIYCAFETGIILV